MYCYLAGHSEAGLPFVQRGAAGFLASYRGEPVLALEQAKRISESIAMAKLCQDKNRCILASKSQKNEDNQL